MVNLSQSYAKKVQSVKSNHQLRESSHEILSLIFFVICSFTQARNIQTKEVVAIKKMSFTGKQSSEVTFFDLALVD